MLRKNVKPCYEAYHIRRSAYRMWGTWGYKIGLHESSFIFDLGRLATLSYHITGITTLEVSPFDLILEVVKRALCMVFFSLLIFMSLICEKMPVLVFGQKFSADSAFRTGY